MIITDTEASKTIRLFPPEAISRPPSRTPSESHIPPPVHPSIQYGPGSSVVPPGYATTTKPTESITYIFEPRQGENSMILHPLATNEQDVIDHAYYISVNSNCFTPSSYITSIWKYGRHKNFVGDFEIAAKNSKSVDTVFFRGMEHPIEEVLVTSSRLFYTQWTWKPAESHFILYWDDSLGGNSIACFKSKDKTNSNLLAKFIPRTHMRRPGREIEYTRLEVTPGGHELFEDVLISALIIERLRTNT
ncbi:hypothetical protein EV361DRAFT_392567 [Lentinula raphanica]|uniref:Uncharacterized protein n=1 Tax=Lentinula raphanica TaxID=153919 RepID=A0AA38PLP1_9AGAR|nr:hypothetical protein F5880DRAFT_169759 [Lentinula raphanica]KAJ3844963.1 hypothetical protein F5878DRAFT_4580 [Lentinula raphanica]KAJ3977867.1 hypothetical protein EV361DRAFT_392567 [Lentinula raphanica]